MPSCMKIKILLVAIGITILIIIFSESTISKMELKAPIKHAIAPNPTGSQMIGVPEPMEMWETYPAIK